MKRRGGETQPQTFSTYAAAINNTPDLDLPTRRACRWMCRCWSRRPRSPA
jgi:hypothetical protein